MAQKYPIRLLAGDQITITFGSNQQTFLTKDNVTIKSEDELFEFANANTFPLTVHPGDRVKVFGVPEFICGMHIRFSRREEIVAFLLAAEGHPEIGMVRP